MPTPHLLQDTAELTVPVPAAPLRVVACAARTDCGMRRPANEDAMLVAAPLLAVADGVGGHRAGEEASAMVVDVLRREVRAFADDPATELHGALVHANAAVRASARVAGREGMATTIVAALVGAGSLTVAHVGDSRAYLLRGGQLQQLTDDHTLVAALVGGGALDAAATRTHPMRAVILRALGLEEEVRPVLSTHDARRDDVVLLCSDGLSDALDASELARLLCDEHDLDRVVERLASAAAKAGTGDDVTAVAARLG